MAIKVVQGLIDVSAPEPIRSSARATGEVVNSRSSTIQPTAQQQLTTVNQQTALISQAAAQVVVHSEASVNAVRLRAASAEAARVRDEIRDPEEATEVAEAVAERVTDDEDEALDAHQTLSSSVARDHFTH